MIKQILLVALLVVSLTHGAARQFYVDERERLQLRDLVKDMFYHAYDNYMKHAFPKDELKPMSCTGEDTIGRYSLTYIDALDTLVVMGNHTEFEKAVRWISQNINFDIDWPVSVFETSIRVLGGILSAHIAAIRIIDDYNGELLGLALDLGERLLKAFDTPTGIPYGTVNLRHGVPRGETTITSTASAGTFSLEFGTLSRLTGRPEFEEAAKRAVRSVWARRSTLNLLGNHIDVANGEWTHKDAGIGSAMDSFFEYLLKAAIYFQDYEYLEIFHEAYDAINAHLKKDPWYVDVQMSKGGVVWALFSSLQAFWPGVQVMYDDVEPATSTLKAFHSVWRRYGFTPEGFNLISGEIQPNSKSYPLRPELIESIYYTSRVCHDPLWTRFGRDIVHNLNNISRVQCGFAHIIDAESHHLSDHMESFFLSETCKYLYLLFDEDNFVNQENYIFTTEGHILPYNTTFTSNGWKYPKCKGPSYLRRISADIFELVGIPQETEDDLSGLVDYQDTSDEVCEPDAEEGDPITDNDVIEKEQIP